MVYLDDCTEKGFITRELVLLFVRLLLLNATFEVLISRPLRPRSIKSTPAEERSNLSTHSVNSHAQVHERVDGFHLGPRQSRMLVQPPAILVRDAFSVLDV
jgi:hypothetical protein